MRLSQDEEGFKAGKNESIESVTQRLETLELESYMQAFSDFMESPVKIEDPSEVKHHMGSMIRRWKRLSNEDRFRTFLLRSWCGEISEPAHDF